MCGQELISSLEMIVTGFSDAIGPYAVQETKSHPKLNPIPMRQNPVGPHGVLYIAFDVYIRLCGACLAVDHPAGRDVSEDHE